MRNKSLALRLATVALASFPETATAAAPAASVRREDAGSSRYSIIQRWYADKRETLEAEAQRELARYHPAGYGTSVRDYRQESDGGWSCRFYRSTSCD